MNISDTIITFITRFHVTDYLCIVSDARIRWYSIVTERLTLSIMEDG